MPLEKLGHIADPRCFHSIAVFKTKSLRCTQYGQSSSAGATISLKDKENSLSNFVLLENKQKNSHTLGVAKLLEKTGSDSNLHC